MLCSCVDYDNCQKYFLKYLYIYTINSFTEAALKLYKLQTV